MLTVQDKPALILIDIQKGFDDVEYWGGNRNNPEAEQKAGELLALWRKRNLPVFHIQHCSTDPRSRLAENNPGHELKEVVKPAGSEPVIKKSVNSAFIGTDLRQRLDGDGIDKVVIAGLTTDHCISTTVRMAGNYGYETYIVSNATATFDREGLDGEAYPARLIHDTALASLENEFATVVNTSDLIKLSDR